MEEYFDSSEFKNTTTYKNFMNINNGKGILKVETSTASEAYPIKDVEITISKKLDGKDIIFYKGVTNDSGIIDGIVLPTRKMTDNVEDVSDIFFTTYDLLAYSKKYNLKKEYDVSIFDNVKVIQPVIFHVNDLVSGDNVE
jgi:hypothetical protein